MFDTPERYGTVTRVLHWGMALLFAAQFLSAGARALLPRGDALRDSLWSYHITLGITLFVLVILRGVWGLINLSRRPGHEGKLGRFAKYGHLAIYGLMIVVPGMRILASAGSERGLTYLGLQIFPPRETEIEWMQLPAVLHGEMGWLLAVLLVGHIFMAVGWHHMMRKDGILRRMVG